MGEGNAEKKIIVISSCAKHDAVIRQYFVLGFFLEGGHSFIIHGTNTVQYISYGLREGKCQLPKITQRVSFS